MNSPKDCLPLQEESNERLETLGDSVLGLATVHYLYERFSDQNEGFLTKMKAKLVNGKMLAYLAEKVGLHKYVIISKQIEDNNGRLNFRILEDAFEAFLGAMYLDFQHVQSKSKSLINFDGYGYQITKEWIINVFEEHIDFTELIQQNQNFKDKLMKYMQHNFQSIPKFFEISVETDKNNNNARIFTICVKNDKNVILGVGKGSSKKAAEQCASKNALGYFGES